MNRIKQIEAFIASTPNDPFLHFALAKEYVKENRIEEAEQTYGMLMEKFPDYVATYYHFGSLLKNMGKVDLALEVMQKGIEIAQKINDMHSLSELRQLKANTEFDL